MSSLRFDVTLYFPDDRKEYSDGDGRPHKIQDYSHWQYWIKHALLTSADNALRRCGDAKVSVVQNPELEPIWVRCPHCGEETHVVLQGVARVGIDIAEYPEGSGAPGYIVPDWETGCIDLDDEAGYTYVCDRCGAPIFDTIIQIEDYLKAQKGSDSEDNEGQTED